MISFVDQATSEIQHRIRCAWSAFARHQQELASKSYLLRHRLHLFDSVVTPTMMYGARTQAATKEHEEWFVLHSAKMLRLITQTKRRYKTINRKDMGEKDTQYGERSESTSESRKEDNTHDGCDQDSSISCERPIHRAPQAKKRRKKVGLSTLRVPQRSRWKQADIQQKLDRYTEETEMASSPDTQSEQWWTRPGPIISTRTQRKAGRPTKRWEDDLDEFVKEKEQRPL